MQGISNPPSHSLDVPRSLYEHQRLVALVESMAQEIERLHDDNVQLHAAIKFYRDAVRRCSRKGHTRQSKARVSKVA